MFSSETPLQKTRDSSMSSAKTAVEVARGSAKTAVEVARENLAAANAKYESITSDDFHFVRKAMEDSKKNLMEMKEKGVWNEKDIRYHTIKAVFKHAIENDIEEFNKVLSKRNEMEKEYKKALNEEGVSAAVAPASGGGPTEDLPPSSKKPRV